MKTPNYRLSKITIFRIQETLQGMDLDHIFESCVRMAGMLENRKEFFEIIKKYADELNGLTKGQVQARMDSRDWIGVHLDMLLFGIVKKDHHKGPRYYSWDEDRYQEIQYIFKHKVFSRKRYITRKKKKK